MPAAVYTVSRRVPKRTAAVAAAPEEAAARGGTSAGRSLLLQEVVQRVRAVHLEEGRCGVEQHGQRLRAAARGAVQRARGRQQEVEGGGGGAQLMHVLLAAGGERQ